MITIKYCCKYAANRKFILLFCSNCGMINVVRNMTIGEAIKERRNKLGLSQDVLGKKIGANDSCVSRIERGGKVQIDTLAAIAGALETDIADILTAAGYARSSGVVLVAESDMKYLSEDDIKYIKVFTEAFIQKRKREWSDGV